MSDIYMFKTFKLKTTIYLLLLGVVFGGLEANFPNDVTLAMLSYH